MENIYTMIGMFIFWLVLIIFLVAFVAFVVSFIWGVIRAKKLRKRYK